MHKALSTLSNFLLVLKWSVFSNMYSLKTASLSPVSTRIVPKKMDVLHEKDVSYCSNGVYPHIRRMPSALCCFRIMHIRTGTQWIAYCEIMWIVSQFSFWTAESVVREAFPPVVIIAGFVFTFLQCVFVGALVNGVKRFRLALIEAYMIGVVARMLLFFSFLMIIIMFYFFPDFHTEYVFFRKFVGPKLIFCVVYLLLKLYALHVAFKCYTYIAKTKRSMCTPTVEKSPTLSRLSE